VTSVDNTIDLHQQMLSLFENEDMVAFFDVTHDYIEDGSRHTLEGLCKISRPKGKSSTTDSLFMTLIFDTPDEQSWAKVDKLVQGVNWESLADGVGELDSVLSMPTDNLIDSGHYLKQLDIYLSGNITLGKAFLSSKLLQPLEQLSGLAGRNLNFWEDHDQTDLIKKIEALKSGIPKF